MQTENSSTKSSKNCSPKGSTKSSASAGLSAEFIGWPSIAAALAKSGCAAEKWKKISQEFYDRNTLQVARDLLGKVLVVHSGGRVTAGRIVETEAYRANDPACHAWVGKTPRNEIMFGEPGRIYVYFIYGMYEMLNLVTEAKGKPAAVLIRALEPVAGVEAMRKRRSHIQAERDLLNGPGRLARAMGVKMSHKGEAAFGPHYFVLDDGFRPASISVSPRVGISQGQEHDWRFFITENRCVSKAPQNKLGRVLR